MAKELSDTTVLPHPVEYNGNENYSCLAIQDDRCVIQFTLRNLSTGLTVIADLSVSVSIPLFDDVVYVFLRHFLPDSSHRLS